MSGVTTLLRPFAQTVRVPLTPTQRRALVLVALVAAYFVAGRFGLSLAFVHASATAVWPPTGIALAAGLLLGRGVWPAVLAGAFFVNLTTSGSVPASLGIAAGNTLEAWVGALLVERYAGGKQCLDRAGHVLAFALLAAMVSTAVSATLGVASLGVTGLAGWADVRGIWLTWWLGDAGGDLVVAPLLLVWGATTRVAWNRRLALEGAALVVAAVLSAAIVFGGVPPVTRMSYPLEVLCMPVFIWAAFRFRQRGAAVVVALVYAIAVRGTLAGRGPFGGGSPNEALLLLQGFTCIASVTTLVLAALVAEQRWSAERLRQLAVSDALTGLGNYRLLLDTLEREVQRSQRTERPFAVLFLDVNGLKKVNDRHGHLVGSRALWRVAEVLRRTSRVIDVPARYGGDEFAVVLPETGADEARQLARRVGDLLAADGEEPRVTVSAGVAVYPTDGASVGDILRRPTAPSTRRRDALRRAEGRGGRSAHERRRVERVREAADPAAALLGEAHRGGGGGAQQQGLGLDRRRVQVGRRVVAGDDHHRPEARALQLGAQHPAQALGEADGARGVGGRRDDGELGRPDPADGVGAAPRRAQRPLAAADHVVGLAPIAPHGEHHAGDGAADADLLLQQRARPARELGSIAQAVVAAAGRGPGRFHEAPSRRETPAECLGNDWRTGSAGQQSKRQAVSERAEAPFVRGGATPRRRGGWRCGPRPRGAAGSGEPPAPGGGSCPRSVRASGVGRLNTVHRPAAGCAGRRRRPARISCRHRMIGARGRRGAPGGTVRACFITRDRRHLLCSALLADPGG